MKPETSPPPRPRLPDGTRVYAIGDIHGRLDLLDERLDAIARDLDRGAPERVVVVSLGDLIDRGPDSKGVVQRFIDGPPARGPLAKASFVALRGNHEDHMTRFLADFSSGPVWFRNGGLEAARSYLGSFPDEAVADHPALQRLLYRAMPPEHLRFLSRMPSKRIEGDYLFVHAGIRPEAPIERQDPYDLIWIREPFLSWPHPHPKMVVHGHTVVEEPEIRPNRIAIDTGAYRTGRLTCLALEGGDQRILAA